MLSPEYLDNAPSEAMGVIDEFEKYVIAEVAKRLVLLGYDEHSETFRRKLKSESDKLFKQVLTQVGSVANHSDTTLRKTFEEAINTNVRSENDRFKSWGMAAVGVTPKMVRIATEHYAFAKAEVRKYCARSAYSSSKLLIDVAGDIYKDVHTGKETYHKIIKRYIEKLSRKGLTVTHPNSGRVDSLDVAVRRSVLTAINQASGKVNLEYCEEVGLDLVEVTSHMGARPTHAAWQGGVYSRSGSSAKYPDFETSTGYGTGAGLCGWNCRHNFYGYVEGMPRARSDDELASLDDGTLTWGADTFTPYEASQKQRELERGIRATKRELVGLESAGRSAPAAERHVYTKAYEAKAVKLARQRGELTSFCKATGRRIDRTRTSVIAYKDKHGRIYAFGRKEAGKARKAANKSTKFKFEHLGRRGATKEEKALYKLLKHGYETGNEGLLWLDKEYNQLVPFRTGSQNRVYLGAQAEKMLKESADRSIISIHNHPNSSAFSPDDLGVACKYRSINELQVVGHDGTRYFMVVGNGERPTTAEIKREFGRKMQDMKPTFDRLIRNGVDTQTVWQELTHRVNRKLAAMYGWRYRRAQ